MNAPGSAALPSRAALDDKNLYIGLRDVPVFELQDAFLQSTLNRVKGEERYIEISRADVGRVPATTAPAGIVLHTGRSGSSLVSQLLRCHPGVVVYAEPLAINQLLMPPHKWPREELIRALRSVNAAFADHAGRPHILKLTAWNTLFADLVTEAFPDTPYAFVTRDPIEVGVSLFKDLPGWYQQGSVESDRLAAFVAPKNDARSPEDYVSRVYAAMCDAVCKADAKKGLFVDYESLPNAVWSEVAPHFGLKVDGRLKDDMNKTAKEYSKGKTGSTVEFHPDSQKKQAAASKPLREASDAIAKPALKRVKAHLR